MRVIAGDKKGMNLLSSIDKNTRPTESKIRESIFNVLFQIKKEANVLDLFAGTGAVGIEFLSRGAACCVFSEYKRENLHCINDNLEHTKLKNKALIYKGDFKKNLLNIARTKMKFDYIYIDPPYDKTSYYNESLEMIYKLHLLNKDAIIILEANTDYDALQIPPTFRLEKTKKYGKRKVVYYIREANND